MIRTVLLLTWLASPALADTLPALFAVTGVAGDDTLNIRINPDASTEPIGTLPPDAQDVEVITLSGDGRWGMVNGNERAGWVAMRFLARQPGPDWLAMQTPLTCHGTEPFWTLRANPAVGKIGLSQMDADIAALGIDWSAPTSGRPDRIGWHITGPATDGFATLQTTRCTDGMSDQQYGIGIDFFLKSDAGTIGYSGCCSLVP
ncbi:MAG: peptide-binding protein [Paracoccaceae bacterium]